MATYEYVILTKAVAEQYQNLTYPAYREHLKYLDNSTIAIGVNTPDAHVGLILAKFYQSRGAGEILSIFVVPEYRQQGIGGELLKMMENLLTQCGCEQVSLVYLKGGATTYLEKILLQREWGSPQSRMMLAQSDCIRADNPSVMSAIEDCLRRSPLPEAFTICPWSQVTPSELNTIKQHENIWYPDVLSPFQDEDIIEHTNSLGLRYQHEVVGWMITHRSAPDVIRYTSLFVREDLQRVGRAIPPWVLLLKSFFLQAHHSQTAKGSFTVIDGNDRMLRIVNRRIAPFLSSVRHSMGATKSLKIL